MKFTFLVLALYFFVISNVTIYDDEIKYIGAGFIVICVYSIMALAWYKAMRWMGFGPLFTPRKRLTETNVK